MEGGDIAERMQKGKSDGSEDLWLLKVLGTESICRQRKNDKMVPCSVTSTPEKESRT